LKVIALSWPIVDPMLHTHTCASSY